MRILKFIGFFLLIVIVAVVVMLILGARLPRAHVASATIEVAAPQARVWQLIEDTASQPQWRQGLTAIQPLPSQAGHPCWLEIQKYGKMPMCEILAAPPADRIVQIADPKLPFGGTWTYELKPEGAGATSLTIIENGTTGPILFRFLAHYVFHEDSMIKQYEVSLQKAAAKP